MKSKLDKLFVDEYKGWCLFGVDKDDDLFPLYCGNDKFWRGGDNTSLACYDTYQRAYCMKKKAKKVLSIFKNVIVRKIAIICLNKE